MVKKNPVRIHSAIVEKTSPSHKLWYLMKSANASGSGRCFLPIQQILDTLQISKSTLMRYYADPDFFYQEDKGNIKPPEITKKGYLVIYPVAISKICLAYNISDLGAISEINQENILHVKKWSALSILLKLQSSSRYIANKMMKKAALDALGLSGKQRLPKGVASKKALTDDQIYSLFDTLGESPSELNFGILKSKVKKIFVNESWVVFGGSQNTAAIEAGKNIRTINRRVKQFEKLSVAKLSTESYEELQFIDSEEWSKDSQKYFLSDGKCYERLCSIYKPILHLFNCRCLRRKVKKLLASVNSKAGIAQVTVVGKDSDSGLQAVTAQVAGLACSSWVVDSLPV